MRPRDQSYVLSMDGKKLAPGLAVGKGDIDLLGFEENGETLAKAKGRLERELQEVSFCSETWPKLTQEEKISKLERLVSIVSYRIKDLRVIFLTLSKALKRLQKEAGTEWRASKFVYAISSVQSHMFRVRCLIRRLLELNNCHFALCSSVNNTSVSFVTAGNVDAFQNQNWISLKEVDDLPEDLAINCEFTKQRSEQWFELRKAFPLTGSKIYEGIGLDTLKALNKHIERNKYPEMIEEISDDVKARMDHGTKSEINAVATLVGKILPMYFPGLQFIEEGSHIVTHKEKATLLVSPDGSIGQVDMHSSVTPLRVSACEFKCPVPSDFRTPVHYEIPSRYIPQILAEMASMKVSSAIYLCWTEESSTIFSATFDDELWSMIMDEADILYNGGLVKKQTKLSDRSKTIKRRLEDYKMSNVEFLCEVSSLTGSSLTAFQTTETSPYNFPIPVVNDEQRQDSDVENVLSSMSAALKEAYEVCRKKATEVLVWLLSDSDRKWNAEIPHSVPVAYALKGYSLGTVTMRQIHNHVLQACHDQNVDVICSCFDGQWIKLATRDDQDEPLTKLQLQRDVVEKAKRKTRNTILHELVTTPIVQAENDLIIERGEKKDGFSVSCTTLRRMLLSAQNSSTAKTPDTKGGTVSDGLSYLPMDVLESLSADENLLSDFVSDNTAVPTAELAEHAYENTSEDKELPTDNPSDEVSMIKGRVKKDMYIQIISNLQSHSKPTVKKRWHDKSADDLKMMVESVHDLHKMSHDELNVLLDGTKELQKQSGFTIKKSLKQSDKANAVSHLIGSGEKIGKENMVRRMFSLKDCAVKILRSNPKSVPKNTLNNVFAAFIYESEEKEWIRKGPFEKSNEINDLGKTEWFSYPEYNSSRRRLEPKCLDAHHLLVNSRVKVCKDGVDGIQKQAWKAVAEFDSNIINKAIVVDLIDKQNNAYAQKVFSNEVEVAMQSLGFFNEASFCKMMREWYEAEDQPGLPAKERVMRRLRVKEFLLKDIDFGIFPAFGQYVKGFPKVWYEGMLQRIDTTIQLYGCVRSGCYNQRAISSLVNETFFGELTDMEPTRLGCPKAVAIPRLMSSVTELLHYRCDPSDRVFHMNTTRKSVYQKEPLLPSSPGKLSSVSVDAGHHGPHQFPKSAAIVLRDHSFDLKIRRRKQRKSKRTDVSKPHCVSRGCLPIRQYHKCDESKILATTRLGIEMKDIEKINDL